MTNFFSLKIFFSDLLNYNKMFTWLTKPPYSFPLQLFVTELQTIETSFLRKMLRS